MIKMAEEKETMDNEEYTQTDFKNRFFLKTDENNYITGMIIAFSQSEAEDYEKQDLTEVSEETYQKVGPYSRLIDGQIEQGEVFEPELSPEANEAIKKARIASASQKISILTDLTDEELVDSVSEEDKAKLLAWRKYRIALSKVDITQGKPAWPTQPED